MDHDTLQTQLALERYYQEPVPLTLGRLRLLLEDLVATHRAVGAATVSDLRGLLARHGLLELPLTRVAALVAAVHDLPPAAEVADFTPRQLEDLLLLVQ